MRKNKVIPLQQPQVASEKLEDKRGTLPWAHEMTGQARVLVHRLESLSRMMSEVGHSVEKELTIDAKDLVHTMAMFSDHLEQVNEILEEVETIIEEVNPSVRAVNE